MNDEGRIEEVDTDEEYADEYAGRLMGVNADGRRARRRRDFEYEEYPDTASVDGVDYDLYDGDDTVAYAVQLAMKDKEERLVEKALDRIRRAQMMGQENVRLSRRELDALERKRMQDNGEGGSRRQSGGSKTPDRRKSKAAKADSGKTTKKPRRSGTNVPKDKTPPRPSSSRMSQVSPNARPSSSSDQRPWTPTTESLRRRQSSAPSFQQHLPSRHPSALEPRRPPSRNQGFRPLPDDPGWAPPYGSIHATSHPDPLYQPLVPFDPRYGRHSMGYTPSMPPYPDYSPYSDEAVFRRTSYSPRGPPPESESESPSEEEEEEDEDEESGDSGDELEMVNVVERRVPTGPQTRAATSRNSSRQFAHRG